MNRRRIEEGIFKFLMVLTERHRQALLAEMCATYKAELDKYYNRVEVSVESTVDLNDKERKSLSSKLSGYLKRDVVLKIDVNPRLLGGLVCRIGDVVYDGSLRRRLDLLSNQMLKAKI